MDETLNMTSEDKTLLRFAMRHLAKAQRAFITFDFKLAKDELDVGYSQIQKLAIAVEMNKLKDVFDED